MQTPYLYLLTALVACLVTATTLPLYRRFIGPALLDKPGGLKHHLNSVPCVGGFAIFTGLALSLVFIRLATNFPTGTLHSLRGILCGSAMIFALGILDDLKKPQGLSISIKLFVQIVATCCIIAYGVHITLFDYAWLDYLLTFLWVIGITNAFNLLDIADGLCISQAFIAALGLFLIVLPTEQIYVNFCACAIAGACAGFWPYNHTARYKSFLGDSGSTLLGFVLASLTMGTGYSQHSVLGFLAPLLILAVPLFDTAFVSWVRLLQGKNPLQGSPDHIAIRLKTNGWSAPKTLVAFMVAALGFNILAWLVTQASSPLIITIYLIVLVILGILAWWLTRLQVKQ